MVYCFTPQLRFCIIVFIGGIVLHQAVEAEHARRQRKNPADYVNEVDPNPPPVEEEEKKSKC